MITLEAPAKINLTLEALSKRPDGYHEIRSVMQSISLCDSFSFSPAKKIVFKCDNAAWDAKQSLIAKAVDLLKEAADCQQGATIELAKRIPLSSGLGGDSSDAAAVLIGLNRLWGLGLSPGEMARLASRLGSDVPFFLCGGTALAQGRGEDVSPLPPLPRSRVVLLMPPVRRCSGKTGHLYAGLTPLHYTGGLKTEELVSLLTKGGDLAPDNLFNVFDSVADEAFEGLADYRQRFIQAGAENIHLSGSGPALFTLLKEKAKAENIYQNLKDMGLEAYLAETDVSIGVV